MERLRQAGAPKGAQPGCVWERLSLSAGNRWKLVGAKDSLPPTDVTGGARLSEGDKGAGGAEGLTGLEKVQACRVGARAKPRGAGWGEERGAILLRMGNNRSEHPGESGRAEQQWRRCAPCRERPLSPGTPSCVYCFRTGSWSEDGGNNVSGGAAAARPGAISGREIRTTLNFPQSERVRGQSRPLV